MTPDPTDLRKIKPNDTVRLSGLGLSQGFLGRAKSGKGKVLAVDEETGLLLVQRDGIRTPDWYSHLFWDRE